MPTPAVAAMTALQVIRGGEDHAPEFIEVKIFAFDGLRIRSFRARRRIASRLAEPHQTLPAQARAHRMRFGQLPLHLSGNDIRLAPARPLVGAAIGDTTRILPPARRANLFWRQHLARAVSKPTLASASVKLFFDRTRSRGGHLDVGISDNTHSGHTAQSSSSRSDDSTVAVDFSPRCASRNVLRRGAMLEHSSRS